MAFEGLSEKLQGVFKKLTGRGKLNEKDIKEAMREVRLALLEADVNFLVVKSFIKSVSDRCVGAEVLESLTPGQQVIKIVSEELTALMGGGQSKLNFAPKPPTIIMLVGLQGAGKTTMCGKLGAHLKKQYGRSPLLVGCDIYRPAAIKQLQVVGEKLDLPVFERGQSDPVETALLSIQEAERKACDLIIVDTAGRLHIDEEMMDELVRLKEAILPTEILLTVDAMTGQDAVNVAKTFDEMLDITGVILTKLDGDTRGGAALSVRSVTGKPIKFTGIGEKLTDIEPFYPDRMASRILGMGDVLSLIEKAQASFDEKQAADLAKKMVQNRFTLDDFLSQMQQMKNMGSMQDLLSMIPGGNKLANVQFDEKALARTEAIILSMTKEERENPDIINGSRRKRIAKGCGMQIQDVNRLLNQFDQTKKLMKQFSGFGKKGKKGFRLPF
ncbi:MAG: signal recognition particle protein [Christensenellales bacterium]|jgi:signal recognition particle subunit SRP54